MNEQLRKAILDAATLEEIVIEDSVHGTIHTDFYRRQAVDASQAKLLRVIEMLVEQRDRLHVQLREGLYPPRIKQFEKEMDAKLFRLMRQRGWEKIA